jgi:methyl-accepting chemotaxis protein
MFDDGGQGTLRKAPERTSSESNSHVHSVQKEIFLMRAILVRGLIVALLVGTLLTLINQFERVMTLSPLNWWKMGLSYVVPFCVSVFSALAVKPPSK